MPGNQVKDWDLYHKLIAQGYSKEQAARIANAAHKKKVAKAFSSSFSSRRKRRNQLVARLKSRRKYPPPVRGGTGKQRSRVKSTLMNKVERIAKAREMMKTSEPTSIAKRIASANFAPGPGLCIGKVELEDGGQTLGVLGEPLLCEGMREITRYGGWRAYVAARERER